MSDKIRAAVTLEPDPAMERVTSPTPHVEAASITRNNLRPLMR